MYGCCSARDACILELHRSDLFLSYSPHRRRKTAPNNKPYRLLQAPQCTHTLKRNSLRNVSFERMILMADEPLVELELLKLVLENVILLCVRANPKQLHQAIMYIHNSRIIITFCFLKGADNGIYNLFETGESEIKIKVCYCLLI